MSIVTGTIRHRNATVWDLTFDGRTEDTLGVTANHPLYSETRHAWIPAGDLQLDEVVRTLNGHSTLTARSQRPTRETVFNLEVHRSLRIMRRVCRRGRIGSSGRTVAESCE
jgi:hypothetical protein